MSGYLLTAIEPQMPAGLYGKVPAKGDFICRRLSRGFVDPWDAWLQRGIERSQAVLRQDWLAAYLQAPLWRFGLVPGICGEYGAAGVLMASVDRVGRYFPLTLAALLPSHARPARVFSTSAAWFEAAEALLLEALDQPFDFEALDQRVFKLGTPDIIDDFPVDSAEIGAAIRVSLRLGADFATLSPILVDSVLAALRPSYSLWWTVGSELVAPACVICQGLPSEDDFITLMTGHTQRGADMARSRPADGDG
jgi:type VI secretion system protein ImpM